MKKTTLIIWAIIFGFMALVIFQNQAFFMARQSLRINFGIFDVYHAPEFPIAVIFLIFFLAGIVIAYLFNFPARFRARQTIKKLNATIASHNSEVAGLKSEIQSLKGEDASAEELPAETMAETNEIKKRTGDHFTEKGDEKTEEISIEKQAANPTENSEETASEKHLSS
jgi:uncharacterized integral membrane protein